MTTPLQLLQKENERLQGEIAMLREALEYANEVFHYPATQEAIDKALSTTSDVWLATHDAKIRKDAREYAGAYGHLHVRSDGDLEADYALLAATQAAIEAQTVECRWCEGDGYVYRQDCKEAACPDCNGRGRVPK